MNHEERYLFDLMGYLFIEQILFFRKTPGRGEAPRLLPASVCAGRRLSIRTSQ